MKIATYNLTNLGAGNHILRAKATDGTLVSAFSNVISYSRVAVHTAVSNCSTNAPTAVSIGKSLTASFLTHGGDYANYTFATGTILVKMDDGTGTLQDITSTAWSYGTGSDGREIGIVQIGNVTGAVYISVTAGAMAKQKLTTPVLTDLSADGVCKFSFPNDTRAYAYKVFVDGTEQGYGTKWTAELAGDIYTVTMNDSCFPTAKTYSITAQAYSQDGTYQDSDISAPITFTKAESQGYYITFANIAYDETISEHVFIQINGEGNWIDLDNLGSLEEYNNVKFFKIYYVPNGTVSMALLNNDGSYPDMEDPSLSPFDITSATSVDTAMTIPVTEGNTDFIVTVFATSAFKQIQLIKILNDTYSAIGAAKTSKIYTIKDLEQTGTVKLYYDATNSQWGYDVVDTGDLRLDVNNDASNASTIVFRGFLYDAPSGSSLSYSKYIALEGDNAATASDFNSFTATNDANLVTFHTHICFAENTLISTRDGAKKVQDISYDDDILVWNFDEGRFDYAKPIFIKQEQTADSYWHVTDEDGKTVNLVGSNGKSHRLYNKRTHLFEYPQDIPECKCEEIHESVKYYNIITAYHFNCFANGILTSNRYSNMLYPITDEMKYDKTVKHTNTCKREQFNFLTDDEFKKLRLSEMEYSDEMRDYAKRFFTLKR
jgi:hypothetical protein